MTLSLRISITDRCQLRCQYCMPAEGITSCPHENILSYEEILSFVRRLQTVCAIEKVRITGGDPLVRKHVEYLVGSLAQLGVPDLALTTNAQRLESKALALRQAGLNRVNISLDSLQPETYRQLSRVGDLGQVLSGIKRAKQCGLTPIKLNMVVIRGINNDEVIPMASFAIRNDLQLRFLELMPVSRSADQFADRFVSSEEIRSQLMEVFDLTPRPYTYGSTSRNYEVRDRTGRQGVLGFISACTEPFCGGCNRLRLTADGHLIGCLARGQRIPVRPFLAGDDSAALTGMIKDALASKRDRADFTMKQSLAAVGG